MPQKMGSQEENYTAPITDFTVESESVQDGPSLSKDSDLQVRAITPYGKYKSISKKLYLQLCQNFVNNFTKIYIIFTRLTLSKFHLLYKASFRLRLVSFSH